MFEALTNMPADSLLALIKAYAADPRPGKVDLGVGVYRNSMGQTPVMSAVKAAEDVLLKSQDSKKYLGPEGDVAFVSHLIPIIFGENDKQHIVGIQTPGGSGALRLGSELIKKANAGAQVWLGQPTWPNHDPIFRSAGLQIQAYPFIDLARQKVEFDALSAALMTARKGDIVLLHGCCHNPTGIDFSRHQWETIAGILATRQLIPFIDLAYQGLGNGLVEDAISTRLILEAVDEALVAYSCDKNFGMYRDRVGGLYVVTRNTEDSSKIQSNLASLARVNWSMPPDHGAAVVRIILESPELSQMWRSELEEMRLRIQRNRQALAGTTPDLSYINQQTGLFSNLAISKEKAIALRANHAIYIADSGRINLAGMQPEDADKIAKALATENCLSNSF